MNIHLISMLSLQLFADGGDGAGTGVNGTAAASQNPGVTEAAAVPQHKGVKANPLANVKYGIQEETAPAAEEPKTTVEPKPEDRNAEFRKLIEGDYREQYNQSVQELVRKRLKGTQPAVDAYNAISPSLDILAKKYGTQPGDYAALAKAIEADDSYLSDEAIQRGMSVQELRNVRNLERENARFRQQQARASADRMYAQWAQQGEETQKVYPSFDMKAEMENPKFRDLLKSNIDVRTAYEVLHKDEIIPSAMQFAAKTVEQKLTNKILANGARPSENGNAGQSAAVVKNDVSKLTKADRDEIIRRAARGEKIRF